MSVTDLEGVTHEVAKVQVDTGEAVTHCGLRVSPSDQPHQRMCRRMRCRRARRRERKEKGGSE